MFWHLTVFRHFHYQESASVFIQTLHAKRLKHLIILLVIDADCNVSKLVHITDDGRLQAVELL